VSDGSDTSFVALRATRSDVLTFDWLDVDYDGTAARFYVNGTLCGTITSPTLPATAAAFGLAISVRGDNATNVYYVGPISLWRKIGQ
jgi:hypothetical protein